MCKWISSLTSNHTNFTNSTSTTDTISITDTISTTDYTRLCETSEYKQYKKKATDYFVSKEIETYKSNSNDQGLKINKKNLLF